MLLAADPTARDEALLALERAQHEDFTALLAAVGNRPVTVRLLDAPLHEFLPAPGQALDAAEEQRAVALREANPMLGLRGVRLALLHERLYPAQAEALFTAWADVAATGVRPELEVMIPLVSMPEELAAAAAYVRGAADAVAARTGVEVPYRLGTMIETPRAALLAWPSSPNTPSSSPSAPTTSRSSPTASPGTTSNARCSPRTRSAGS